MASFLTEFSSPGLPTDRFVPLYASWRAEEAYREWIGSDEGGNFSSTWFIRWEDRFVRLTAYRELTEEQMGIIAQSLLQWKEGPADGA